MPSKQNRAEAGPSNPADFKTEAARRSPQEIAKAQREKQKSFSEKRAERKRLEAEEEEERQVKLGELAAKERVKAEESYRATEKVLTDLEEEVAKRIKERTKHEGVYPEAIEAAGYPAKYGFPTKSYVPFASSVTDFFRKLKGEPVDQELVTMMKNWKALKEKSKALKAKAAINEDHIQTPEFSQRVAVAKARAKRIDGAYEDEAKRASDRATAEEYRESSGMDDSREVIGKEFSSGKSAERAFFDDRQAVDDFADADYDIEDDGRTTIPPEAPSLERKGMSEAEMDAADADAINEYLRANMASDEEIEAGSRRPRSVLSQRGSSRSMGTPSLERSQDRVGALRLSGLEAAEVPSETPTQILTPLYNKVQARLNQLLGEKTNNVEAAPKLKDSAALKREADALRSELDLYFQTLRTSDAYKWVDKQIAQIYDLYRKQESAEQKPLLDGMERGLRDLRAQFDANKDLSPEGLDMTRRILEDLEQSYAEMWSKIKGDDSTIQYMWLGDQLAAARRKYFDAVRTREERNRQPRVETAQPSPMVRAANERFVKAGQAAEFKARHGYESEEAFRNNPEVSAAISRLNVEDSIRARGMYDFAMEHAQKLDVKQQERLKKILGTEDVGTAYVLLADKLERSWNALKDADLSSPSEEVDQLLREKGHLTQLMTSINELLGLPKELHNTMTWEAYTGRAEATTELGGSETVRLAPDLMEDVRADLAARKKADTASKRKPVPQRTIVRTGRLAPRKGDKGKGQVA